MTAPKVLSRFESNLVLITRYFVSGLSAAQAHPLIFQALPRPHCLSRQCVALVQDALAKGCTRLLAAGDGWRRERYLRGNQIANGRLWQRTPPRELGLHFSRHTLEMLCWFTAEIPAAAKSQRAAPPAEQQTPADALVCYHAYAALRETEAGPALAGRLGFGDQALCQLAYPGDFVQKAAAAKVSFASWTRGVGPCLLEAMQTELSRRLVAAELSKRQVQNAHALVALSATSQRVFAAFFDALEQIGRLDLAQFLLTALAELLPEQGAVSDWLGDLSDTPVRLADRAAAHSAALVLPRQLDRLQRWQREAQLVGYFDEHYAASQLWKSAWEFWQGETLCAQAEALLRPSGTFALEDRR